MERQEYYIFFLNMWIYCFIFRSNSSLAQLTTNEVHSVSVGIFLIIFWFLIQNLSKIAWHYKIRINRVSHIILDRYWLLNRFSESEILRKIIHFMKLCKANIKICCRKHKGFLVTYFGVEAWRWYGMRSVLKLQSLKKYKISNKKSTLDG